MTNQLPADSGLPAGTQDANPAVSAPASAQPNSSGTLMTPEDYRRIAREESEKVWQSGKDRRFDQIGKEQARQSDLLARIEAKMNENPSLSIAQAKREAQLDMIVEGSQSSAPSTPASQGSGAQGATSISEWDVLQELGLTENSPGVMDALREAGGNPAKFAAALYRQAAASAGRPNPTPALNAAPVSALPPATEQNVEELTREYKSKMIAARGKPTELKEIRKEYTQRGVPTHAVDFT